MEATNSWLIRSNPSSEEYGSSFFSEGFVGVGWGETGDLSQLAYNEIRNRIKKAFPNLIGRQVSIPLSVLCNLSTNVQKGDFIITPEGSNIHIGRATSNYYYAYAEDLDYLIAHRVNVKWLKIVKRDILSENLRGSLRTQRTLAKLSSYTSEITSLTDNGAPLVTATRTQNLTITINKKIIKIIDYPENLSDEEIDALGKYLKKL